MCGRWRETALNHPHVWSHINFGKLTPVGIAEMVARAKMAPLHLDVEILAWTTPGADVGDFNSITTHPPVRMAFRVRPKPKVTWGNETDDAIVDARLTQLPVKAVSTFSTHNETRLRKEFWLRHASILAGLTRLCLAPSTFQAFRVMLAEAPPDGPRLPRLTKLILSGVSLTQDISSVQYTHESHGARSPTGDPRSTHVHCGRVCNSNVGRDSE